MAISNYGELKTKVSSWGRRSGNSTFVAEVPDIITLAEARLNRELGPVETNASRTGTIDSRSIDISALSVVEPIALWVLTTSSADEQLLEQQSPHVMPYATASGEPKFWAMDSTSSLKLDRPCLAAYSFRFRFRQSFNLSTGTDSDTNWLLTNHPDIYLAAALMWGAGYREDWQNGAAFKQILDIELPRVAHNLAKRRRGNLVMDAAFLMSNGSAYNVFTDE